MDMMMAETLLAYIYHGKWKLDFLHHYLHSTHTSAEHQDLLNDSSISPLFAFCQRNEAWALRDISSSHVERMTTSDDEENVLET